MRETHLGEVDEVTSLSCQLLLVPFSALQKLRGSRQTPRFPRDWPVRTASLSVSNNFLCSEIIEENLQHLLRPRRPRQHRQRPRQTHLNRKPNQQFFFQLAPFVRFDPELRQQIVVPKINSDSHLQSPPSPSTKWITHVTPARGLSSTISAVPLPWAYVLPSPDSPPDSRRTIRIGDLTLTIWPGYRWNDMARDQRIQEQPLRRAKDRRHHSCKDARAGSRRQLWRYAHYVPVMHSRFNVSSVGWSVQHFRLRGQGSS